MSERRTPSLSVTYKGLTVQAILKQKMPLVFWIAVKFNKKYWPNLSSEWKELDIRTFVKDTASLSYMDPLSRLAFCHQQLLKHLKEGK